MSADLFALPPWHDIGREKLLSVPGVLQSMTTILGEVPDALDDEPKLWAFANSTSVPICDADVEDGLIWPNRRFAARAWLAEEYSKFILFAMENHWLDEAIAPAKPWPFESQKVEQADVGGIEEIVPEFASDPFPIPGVPTLEESQVDDGIPRRKPRKKKEEIAV